MYHVSAQGVDERMINVHYYYYYYCFCFAMREMWVTVLGKATAESRAALPIPSSVCSVFLRPDSGMAASTSNC